jgi:hypothetical protein
MARMSRALSLARSALFAVTVFAPCAAAQAPSPADLAKRAHALAAQLREPASEPARVLAEEKLAAFVAEATGDAAKDWTAQHFVEAGSPLLQDHAAEALAISEAGAKRFADSRFLWDHVGFARLGLAAENRPGAARVAALQRAKDAFATALKLQPETVHAHVGMFQALDLLDEVDGALRELAAIEAAPVDGKPALPDPGTKRAGLLLRAGKPKDALAALDALGTADADAAVPRAILRVRAYALRKDAAPTMGACRTLLTIEDTPRIRIETADALFFVGDKAAAEKELMRLPPPGKWETEEQRIAQLCVQSGKALAAYWSATDVAPKGPLRPALAKALGHSFLVMDPSAKPKPKETDLSASPFAMAHVATQALTADDAQVKNWANRALLVLSLQGQKGYTPPPFEKGILAAAVQDPAKPDDVAGLVLDARRAVGDPDAGCPLSGLHAIERIAGVAAAPKRAGR